MKTYVPDYYSEFACIQGKCRHSCCIGWEIDIDEDSLLYFRSLDGQIGKRLRESIDDKGEVPCFRLVENERCPFLNADGLCDLIIELGEESLCEICAEHPRFRSFFSDREEIGLGLCCEEAARIILTRKTPSRMQLIEDDGDSCMLSNDESELLELRRRLIEIMQKRSLPVQERIGELLREAGLELCPVNPNHWSSFLTALERLDEAWTEKLEDLSQRESKGFQEPSSAFEEPFEQLMVYLLMRHLPGALDDGDLSGRIAFCIRMWQLLRLMQADKDMEHFIDLCRMFSSEIEYSDENTGAIIEYIRNENPLL